MAHNCVDWTAIPPTRKMPLLVLTFGDDHIYTAVPRELKTLEDIARREFNLGDDEIHFSSSCLNLCNGLPARITESAWEHINPYIGCAVVEVYHPRVVPSQGGSHKEQPTPSENIKDTHDLHTERKLEPEDKGEQPDYGPGNKLNALEEEIVRGEQGAALESGDRPSAPEDQHEETLEDDLGLIPRRGRRNWYPMFSEDEGEEPEQEIPARPQAPIASPPRPAQPTIPLVIVTEKVNDYRSHPDSQSPDPLVLPRNPVKQEKRENESGGGSWPHSNDGYSQSLHTTQSTQTQTQVESSENHKLMIRVAHRPSKQESKFTTKGTTKVAKVLAGACKSFGLDAGRATMYLIISTEDEEGVGDIENLFPCDKNDTIARAGAEHKTESRFLLKLAGEA